MAHGGQIGCGIEIPAIGFSNEQRALAGERRAQARKIREEVAAAGLPGDAEMKALEGLGRELEVAEAALAVGLSVTVRPVKKLGAYIARMCHWITVAVSSKAKPLPDIAKGVAVITRIIEAKASAPASTATMKTGWRAMTCSGLPLLVRCSAVSPGIRNPWRIASMSRQSAGASNKGTRRPVGPTVIGESQTAEQT